MQRRELLRGVAGTALAGWTNLRARAQEAKPEIAWGAPRDGFQVGLYYPIPKATYQAGERLAFQLKLKNVGEQAVTLPIKQTAHWTAMLTADNLIRLHPSQREVEVVTLQPGEVRDVPGDGGAFLLQQWDGAGSAQEPIVRLAPGRYRVECSTGIWIADQNDPNRATGLRAKPAALAVEILPQGQAPAPTIDAGRAATGERAVWGKPVNGLQTGLRFKGDNSRFRPGDSAVAELLVRNLSGRSLNFSMYRSEQGWPGNFPSVRNEKGEHQRGKVVFLSGIYPLSKLTLKAEETAVLGYPTLGIQGVGDASPATTTPAFALPPGRYTLTQHESCRPDGAMWFNLFLESGALPFEVLP